MASLITSNETQKSKKNGIEFLIFVFFLKGEGSAIPFSFFWPRSLMFGSQKQNASLSMDWVITFQTFLIPASHPHESFGVTFGSFL